jgi:hypothetical protein
MMWGGVIFAAALTAFPAMAQTPAIVHVLADESQVLVGRTLKMRAVVRDSAGNPINGASVTWAVNQAAAASISSDGTVTAKGLATVRVTARSGNVTGEAAIQTIPSRVEVTPGSMNLEVGAKQAYKATAYDADGAPIPGVNFTWSVTNQRQGSSSTSRIDSTGTLTTTAEGGAFVWATYTYNESMPGLQRQWVGYSTVRITVPKSYQLKRLYSALHQPRSNWKLRPRQSMVWSTDDGQLYFNASLDGLANALLNWDHGKWKVVSGGGVPRFGRGSTALEFFYHSITADGQILSYENTNINGVELNLGTRDEMVPFINNNVPLGNTEAVAGLTITRNSHTSNGLNVVRSSSFRFPNDPINYVGIFRGGTQVNELLISTQETLPGVASPFTIDGDFGISADGSAYYSVTSGSNRVFYRHDAEGRKRLIGVGDPLLGSKVNRFFGNNSANYPSVWYDEDGTAMMAVVLDDNTQHFLSFAPDGKMTSLRLTTMNGILYRHPEQGALLYCNPYNNRGSGIYLWKENDLKPVFVLGPRVFGQTVQAIESGTVNKLGEVTLMLRGDTNALLMARMGAEPTLLFKDGDEVQADLPVNVFTLVAGARTGPPHAQVGGNAGSMAAFVDGDWQLTLGIGARLFGNNTMWFGGSASTSMRKAPNGDIYFTSGAGIGKIVPGGAPQLAATFPLRLENNFTVNAPGSLDINSQGMFVFPASTSAGDNRVYTYKDGVAKQILVYSTTASTATVINGLTVQSFDTFALDDNGRVLARLGFRGTSVFSYGVWDGSQWTLAATPNQTRIGNQLVTALPNVNRACGGKLFAELTVAPGVNLIAEWQGAGWVVAVNVNTIMPNGQNANSISALDVNLRGDQLFQFSNGVNIMVVRRGDQMYQVHNFFAPTPEGDYLIRINAMDLRDDGTVYFLAVTEEDEVVLYQATPLF